MPFRRLCSASFHHLLACVLFTAAVTGFCAAPDSVMPRWRVADKPWDRTLGSHRVILKVGELPSGTKSVAARIEWRRPDPEPDKKAVLVFDLKTGKPVTNVDVESVTNAEGKLSFEPVSGAGEYAVYFLPVKIEGGAFPVGKYTPPRKTADDVWLREQGALKTKPFAEVARWEAVSAHDAWTEMEVIATDEEVAALSRMSPGGVSLLIPGKTQSVRMARWLPATVVQRAAHGASDAELKVRPGEHLIFQLLVWSQDRDLTGVQASASTVRSGTPGWLAAESLVCLNTQRTDWNGVNTRVALDIPRRTAVPLLFSVAIPEKPGSEVLRIAVTEKGGVPCGAVSLRVIAEGELMKDHGDADPQSLSRLRWLNSNTAVDDKPAKGYTPLEVNGRTIRCLGREIELGENGLPVQIRSYFNKAVTKVMEKPTVEMLAEPVGISATVPADGEVESLKLAGSGMKFTRQTATVVEWNARLSGNGLAGSLIGRMEFDGSVNYQLALEAVGQPMDSVHFALNFARSADALDYVLGLQEESGALDPAKPIHWKWDVANKHQDSLWLGAVNGGLRVQLKSDNYVRPSVNIHYKRRPLNNPPSWNGGAGSIILAEPKRPAGGLVSKRTLSGHSGAVKLEPGKPLRFDFDLLITPFHTLRTQEQWTERYFHTNGVPRDYQKYLDGAKAAGANVVNIHQGNWLNPYINYPFLTADKLAAFSNAAHERGMRAKYYYTVRELSNWCPEIFAFRGMGDEILMSGKGGGHPWGEEHLGGNYWQAWYEGATQDVSFLTQPMSRFHNYYIEGLRWLCENAGCDGIYLDDVAYDRSIMLRARKVLDRYCPRGGLIDLHSWNEFHEGGAWAHCANIFMDSMPFVDRIWFGEGHHYNGPSPEHFLIEISGIPFGVMGEMLEGGGNPWMGLVHGCTGRLGWGGNPREVWSLWDDFGVRDAEFIGWWAREECPVRTADPSVKATVWKKKDATLVAVANFSKDLKQAALAIDWRSLGLDPAKAKLYAVPMPQLKQRAALLAPDKPVLLKPYGGAVFIIDEKQHDIAAPPAVEALGALVMEDDFSRGLDKAWKPVVSTKANGNGRVDAGYVFQVPANIHAYLERTLPAEAGAVTARLWQDGADEGQQWGPGLAVVWPDGRTLRANVRKDGRLSVYGGGMDSLDASITSRAPVEFTIRWDKDFVKVIAAGPAMSDLAEEIARFPRDRFPGQPALVRIGKMPNGAGPQDFGDAGPVGFNRIEWVRMFGAK